MTFQRTNKNVQTLTLKIDNINIEQVKEFNFLGIIIDTNLNWKRHTEKMSNTCSKKISILNKLTHVLSQQIKTLLYNSLIVPHINYCIMAWGFQTNRIIKRQKKALRIITLMCLQLLKTIIKIYVQIQKLCYFHQTCIERKHKNEYFVCIRDTKNVRICTILKMQ